MPFCQKKSGPYGPTQLTGESRKILVNAEADTSWPLLLSTVIRGWPIAREFPKVFQEARGVATRSGLLEPSGDIALSGQSLKAVLAAFSAMAVLKPNASIASTKSSLGPMDTSITVPATSRLNHQFR